MSSINGRVLAHALDQRQIFRHSKMRQDGDDVTAYAAEIAGIGQKLSQNFEYRNAQCRIQYGNSFQGGCRNGSNGSIQPAVFQHRLQRTDRRFARARQRDGKIFERVFMPCAGGQKDRIDQCAEWNS